MLLFLYMKVWCSCTNDNIYAYKACYHLNSQSGALVKQSDTTRIIAIIIISRNLSFVKILFLLEVERLN